VHSELFVQRFQRQRSITKKTTKLELVPLIKKLAICANDTQITRVLNRLQRKTTEGRTWTKYEVMQFRQANNIPAFSQAEYDKRGWRDLSTAAKELGINIMSVKKLIQQKIIAAEQVVPYAPWMIAKSELSKPAIRRLAEKIKLRSKKIPLYKDPNQLTLE
jgi:hypothetical protein